MGLVASSDSAHPEGAIAASETARAMATIRRAPGKRGDMRKLWYVSGALASTALAHRSMRGLVDIPSWTTATRFAVVGVLAIGCAGSSASGAGSANAASAGARE